MLSNALIADLESPGPARSYVLAALVAAQGLLGRCRRKDRRESK
jgi:hypothetical protein